MSRGFFQAAGKRTLCLEVVESVAYNRGRGWQDWVACQN